MGRRLACLLLVLAALAGCSDDKGKDDEGRAGGDDTPADESTTTVPGQQVAAPPDCRKLPVAALSDAAGREVVLQLDRSSEATENGTRGFRCVFTEKGKRAEVGAVVYTVHPSADAATTAYGEGVGGAGRLGVPVVPVKRGDAGYAVDLSGTWSCSIRAGARVASATLATAAFEKACDWADTALQTFD